MSYRPVRSHGRFEGLWNILDSTLLKFKSTPCEQKELSFTNGWNKVPVFTDENGEVVVDSTPIMVYIDEKYNNSILTQSSGEERFDSMLAHVDEAWKRATIPILYGSLGAALSTTRRVSKLEKFGFISRRLYAWAGFPIMWGIIARKREKGWANPEETLARPLNRIH